MVEIIVDGKDIVLGRLGSYVAKELLKGNSVTVINSEEVVMSGNKNQIVEKINKKRRMGQGGSLKGPIYIRQSDRLLKRMIRGMLPWDRTKGREAYKRLRCYIGSSDISEEDLLKVKTLNFKRPLRVVTMKEIVRALK